MFFEGIVHSVFEKRKFIVRNKDKSPRIVLFGGLGNQLFQLALGISMSSNATLEIDTTSGNPRKNSLGEADLLSFKLPDFVRPIESQRSRTRGLVYLLALKIASKRFENSYLNIIYVYLKNLISSSRFFGRSFFLADGNGFDPRALKLSKDSLIIGNFHSYRWFESGNTQKILFNLELNSEPLWLSNLTTVANDEKPIVLHIRLGDYLTIPELGILTQNYFEKAISILRSRNIHSKIWLFSDDVETALQYIPSSEHSCLRFIDYDQDNSAANLQAMRLGAAYIISNSTFSWWGAFLSKTPNPTVICPEHWTATKENPLDLIPPNWIKVSDR